MSHNIDVILEKKRDEKLREERKQRGLARRKAAQERAVLAEESTTWVAVVKPYRRGQ